MHLKNIHLFEVLIHIDKLFVIFIIHLVRIIFGLIIKIYLIDVDNEITGNKRKLHRSPPNQIRIAESLQAPKLWKMGHRGEFHIDKLIFKLILLII